MAGKVLMVIGGSGFFGKSILDAYGRGLLRPWQVERIVVVARSARAMAVEHPSLIGGEVSLVDADIGSAATLPDADYVIHAASSTDARRYADFPREERANILRSIDNYAGIAERVHRDACILYTSSGAVYGQQPADLPLVAETFEPAPAATLVPYKRDYADAKRLAEQRLAELGQRGLHVTIARCFAFVGVYLPRDQHFAIGNFIADGLAGRPVRVHARKAVYRSYMHADDLVRWLMTMVVAASPDCPVYNVGSEESHTMGDVARIVAAKFGVAAEVPEFETDEVDRYVPSTAKARSALGLRLTYDLRSALEASAG